jgi:hypothetical protein
MPLTENEITQWESGITVARQMASRLNNLAAKAEEFITDIDRLEVDLSLTPQQVDNLRNKIVAEQAAIRADLLALLA